MYTTVCIGNHNPCQFWNFGASLSLSYLLFSLIVSVKSAFTLLLLRIHQDSAAVVQHSADPSDTRRHFCSVYNILTNTFAISPYSMVQTTFSLSPAIFTAINKALIRQYWSISQPASEPGLFVITSKYRCIYMLFWNAFACLLIVLLLRSLLLCCQQQVSHHSWQRCQDGARQAGGPLFVYIPFSHLYYHTCADRTTSA